MRHLGLKCADFATGLSAGGSVLELCSVLFPALPEDQVKGRQRGVRSPRSRLESANPGVSLSGSSAVRVARRRVRQSPTCSQLCVCVPRSRPNAHTRTGQLRQPGQR